MARQSKVYYINPSNMSIIPNANGVADDLAVYVLEGTAIKIYAPKCGVDTDDYEYREWGLSGGNRHLGNSDKPYTIYVRYAINGAYAYITFAEKVWDGSKWLDKYPYVTEDGWATGTAGTDPGNTYRYVRIGDVSLPEDGERTVTYDTGVLGTDQYNEDWDIDPDELPLRVELTCRIGNQDAGATPYVHWSEQMTLTAVLLKGWIDSEVERFREWRITRNSGDSQSDSSWPSHQRQVIFAETGSITLRHPRSGVDDFNGAVAPTFTVTAMGIPDTDSDSSGDALVELAHTTITVMAETTEQYELKLSDFIASYSPMTETYSPADGIGVNIRATDQKGDVYEITNQQLTDTGLTVEYAPAGSEVWYVLQFTGAAAAVASASIDIAIFHEQKNVNVRLLARDRKELDSDSVAFVRDGEDSREREWIFLRSNEPIEFGDLQSDHPLPSLIPLGEVNPTGAAQGLDPDKNQDGWVPQGWWDEMNGTDEDHRYEYGAYRDYIRASSSDSSSSSSSSGESGTWGVFSTPKIWSYYGKDAVTYRCRWTAGNTEVYQLVASYLGDFHTALPIVATLMKREGDNREEPYGEVSCTITLNFEGINETYTFPAASPEFTISTTEHAAFIAHLNNVDLQALSVIFTLQGGETFEYSIPMVREADEESVTQTVEEVAGSKYLSKVDDDTAAGNITFNKDIRVKRDAQIDGIFKAFMKILGNVIESDNWTDAGSFGTGFQLKKNASDGITSMTVDNLYVRMKAIFNELEVRKMSYAGGNIVFSPAGSKIVRVEAVYDGNMEFDGDTLILSDAIFIEGSDTITTPSGTYDMDTLLSYQGELIAFRCYMLDDDGSMKTRNWWEVGDLARCQTFNIQEGVYQDVQNTFYWREVTAKGSKQLEDGKYYDYIELSVTGASGSTIPAAGDQLVQMGNTVTPSRQGFITIEVIDKDSIDNIAPAIKIYKGVNTYSLDGKMKICFSPVDSLLTVRKLVIETDYDVQEVPMERGSWLDITPDEENHRRCYHYNLVQHNDGSWLCIVAEGSYTTEEPGDATAAQRLVWRAYAKKGQQGDPGSNSAPVFLYRRAASAPDKPQGTLTYTFATGVLTGSLSGWSQTIPSANANPCWVIQTTVSGTGETAAITSDKWSTQQKLVENGQAGADGVSVIVTPSALLLQQDLNDPSNLSNLSEQVLFTVMQGSTQKTVSKVEITTVEQDGSSPKCTVTGSNANYVTLTAMNTYLRDGNRYYYDEAYFICKVYYDANAKYIENVKVKVYAQLVGTWEEKIIADTKQEIAESTWFDLDPTTGNIVESERLGTFVRSSKQNLSRLDESSYFDVFTGNTSTYPISFTLTADDITKYGSTYRLIMDMTSPYTDVTIRVKKGSETLYTFDVKSYDRLEQTLLNLTAGTYTINCNRYPSITFDNVQVFATNTDKYSEVNQTVGGIETTINDPNTGILHRLDTAEGSITEVKKAVNTKNRIQSEGWTDFNGNLLDAVFFNPSTQKLFATEDNPDILYSPVMFLPKGTYVFSMYTSRSDIQAYIYHSQTNQKSASDMPSDLFVTLDDTVSGDTYTPTGGTALPRKYKAFSLDADAYVIINVYQGDEFVAYRPQLEEGTTPTAWEIGAVVKSSTISQKADSINLSIRQGLTETGIDITNNLIKAKANNFKIRNNITAADALYKKLSNRDEIGDVNEQQLTAGETFSIDKYGTITSPEGAVIDGAVIKRKTRLVTVDGNSTFDYADWFMIAFHKESDEDYTLDCVNAYCDMIVLMTQLNLTFYNNVNVYIPVAKKMIGQELTIVNAVHLGSTNYHTKVCLMDVINGNQLTPEWAWGNTPYGFLWPLYAGSDLKTFNTLDITEYSSITIRACEGGFNATGIGSDEATGEWVVVEATKKTQA